MGWDGPQGKRLLKATGKKGVLLLSVIFYVSEA